MTRAREVLELALPVAQKGNENSITDAGVAGLMAMSAVEGAGYNVRINLTGIQDKEFVATMRAEVTRITQEAQALAGQIRALVEAKL
jgi:formiminotetrahydrofolate cyclodeaminase